jgi:hypothetical protein
MAASLKKFSPSSARWRDSRGGISSVVSPCRRSTRPPARNAFRIKANSPGEVVLRRGKWLKGKTLFDAANDLQVGNVILKGVIALDLAHGQAATDRPDEALGALELDRLPIDGKRERMVMREAASQIKRRQQIDEETIVAGDGELIGTVSQVWFPICTHDECIVDPLSHGLTNLHRKISRNQPITLRKARRHVRFHI